MLNFRIMDAPWIFHCCQISSTAVMLSNLSNMPDNGLYHRAMTHIDSHPLLLASCLVWKAVCLKKKEWKKDRKKEQKYDVCVACMIYEVRGERERGERETEEETASKGNAVDFSAPSRDPGGRAGGGPRGKTPWRFTHLSRTPSPHQPSISRDSYTPRSVPCGSQGQPLAPSNEAPGPLACRLSGMC